MSLYLPTIETLTKKAEDRKKDEQRGNQDDRR